jgi:hypothetical protein
LAVIDKKIADRRFDQPLSMPLDGEPHVVPTAQG